MAVVPRKPVRHRNEATADYSGPEAVDPHRLPQLADDDGLQLTYLYGDDTLNGNEVTTADGLEVARDDDKEFLQPKILREAAKKYGGSKKSLGTQGGRHLIDAVSCYWWQ